MSSITTTNNLTTRNNTFCVVRNTGGTWAIINDASHQPSKSVTGVTDIAVLANGNFRLSYNAIPEVGALIGFVDETYAQWGLSVGSSVGTTYTDFYVYKKGISGYVSYNGSDWVVSMSNSLLVAADFTMVMDGTGKLTVTHSNSIIISEAFGVNITPRLGTIPYNMALGAIANNYFECYFKDPAGATVITPTSQMKFYFTIDGFWQVPNSKLGVSGSNIWILGMNN